MRIKYWQGKSPLRTVIVVSLSYRRGSFRQVPAAWIETAKFHPRGKINLFGNDPPPGESPLPSPPVERFPLLEEQQILPAAMSPGPIPAWRREERVDPSLNHLTTIESIRERLLLRLSLYNRQPVRVWR